MKRIVLFTMVATLALSAPALARDHARHHSVDRMTTPVSVYRVASFSAWSSGVSVSPTPSTCAISYATLTMCDVQRVSLSFAEENTPNNGSTPYSIGSCWLSSGTGAGCQVRADGRTGNDEVALLPRPNTAVQEICAVWVGGGGFEECFLQAALGPGS